ncbi:mucin-6-like [Armigeres subalbatus]|uniref:mucin-6-like n=1 Tax=Armigeres subalbatus TaxID=124917 RepID=UPI002ED194A9
MEFDSDEDFFEAAGDPKTEALRKFIELYESLPVLWNCKHDSYKNKAAKNAALDKLVRVYQSVKTGATRADVTKKINSLRTNFRKELKRVVSSKRSGAGADEIYQPSSWLFEALQFLRNTEQPASHITESGKVADVVLRTSKVSNSSPPASHSRSSIITASTPRKKQRIVGPVQKQNEFLTIACKYLQQDASPSTEMPAIAKAWGEKLISLESRQRIFAEKAINDVLYEATLGNLTKTSAGVKHRTDTVSSIEVNNTSPCEDGITSYSESSVASTFGSVTVNKLSHRSSFGSRFDSISSNRESHHAAGFTPCSESSSDVNNNSLCGSYPGPTAGSKFGSTIWNREPHRQAGVTSPQNSSAGVNNTPPYETRNTPYPESPSASKFGPVTMNKMSHHESGVSSYPESSVGSKRVSIISNSIPPEVIESSHPTRSSAGSQIRSITMTGKLPRQVGFTTHAESSVRPYNASHSEEPSTGSKNDSIIANREPYRVAGFTPRLESSGDVNNNPPCRNEIISYPGSTAGSKFGSTLWNREPHRQAGVTSPQNSSAGVNNTPPYEFRNTPYPESPSAPKFGPVTMNRMSHHESDASSYPESSVGSKRVSIITNSIPSEEIESSPPTRSLAGSQFRSITMTGKPPRQVGLTTHAESSVRPYNTEPSTGSKNDSITSNREPHHAAGLTPHPESLRGVNNTPPCGNGIISHPGPSAGSKFGSINDPQPGFEFGSLPFNRKPPNDLFTPDPQSSAGASNASLYESQFASLPRSSAGSEFDLIAANMTQPSEAGFLPNSGSSASAIHISPREDTFSLNLGSSAGTMSSNRTDCVKLGTIVKNITTPYEAVSTTAPVSTTHEFGLPLSQRSSKGAKVQTKSDGPIATINPAKLSLRNVRFRKLPKTSTSVAYVSTSTNSISNPISSEDEIGKQSITSSDAKPGLTSAVKASNIMYPSNRNSKFAHPEPTPDAISEVTPKHHTSNPESPGATLTQHAETFLENESHSISKQHVSNHASLGPELELSEEPSVGAIQAGAKLSNFCCHQSSECQRH